MSLGCAWRTVMERLSHAQGRVSRRPKASRGVIACVVSVQFIGLAQCLFTMFLAISVLPRGRFGWKVSNPAAFFRAL